MIKPLSKNQAKELQKFLIKNNDYFTNYQKQLPTLQEMIHEFFLEVPKGTPLQNKQTLAVYEKEKMSAYVDLLFHYPTETTCTLGLFVIDKDFRGRGYGQKIYNQIEQRMKKKGIKTLRLGVLANNLPAKKMWNKQGYLQVGTINCAYGLQLNMEKKLEIESSLSETTHLKNGAI